MAWSAQAAVTSTGAQPPLSLQPHLLAHGALPAPGQQWCNADPALLRLRRRASPDQPEICHSESRIRGQGAACPLQGHSVISLLRTGPLQAAEECSLAVGMPPELRLRSTCGPGPSSRALWWQAPAVLFSSRSFLPAGSSGAASPGGISQLCLQASGVEAWPRPHLACL